MPYGTLQIYASLAEQSAPLADVLVEIYNEQGASVARQLTDEAGAAGPFTLEAPDRQYSLQEGNTTVRPYAVYRIEATKTGWEPKILEGVQLFDGQETVARLDFLPLSNDLVLADAESGVVTIPPHVLFAGGGGSAPPPADDGTAPAVLPAVIIPRKVTVHLGAPTASVRNVSVSFQNYIANVASSEIYPTWPEEAIRANILAQISLTLNRVWTEWYPSRGYNFTITGSPSYDQAYTEGRTVFAVMERLTAELFNTYVRRTGDDIPYFTAYCDGRIINCAGMKQWGTVDRANAGLNALQILRYYYGNNIQLATTNNVAAIQSSYPGTPLRRGSTGMAVRVIQRQLSRISKDYPSFGKPAITGTFDAATETAVRRFQTQFNLTTDGVVGKSTWYKISYIYVSVKDLAELTSEGETLTGTQSVGAWPGIVLINGAMGRSVELVQFWLSELAQYDSRIPAVAVDGNFGAGTERAVRAFQRAYNLTADGRVGQQTWDTLYSAWVSAQSDAGGTAYPGTALRQGSTGNSVRLIQFWLRMAAGHYVQLLEVSVDGNFGRGTANAVRTFQSRFGLTADGVVGRATWNKLKEVALAVVNRIVGPEEAPGVFPGTVRRGNTGTAVRAVQYYLRLLSAYYPSVPAVTVDGNFGSGTESAVRAWQRQAGLTADGVVGRLTWESLYDRATKLAASGPVARLSEARARTGALQPGDTGTEVETLSRLLDFLSQWLPGVVSEGVTDRYDAALETAVRSAQRQFGRPMTGIATAADQNAWRSAAEALYAVTPASASPYPDGVWPGYTLAEGSAGPAVLQVQRWLNALSTVYAALDFVPENGILDAATLEVLEQYQIAVGLTPLGLVDDVTWESLRQAAAPYEERPEV